MKLQQVTFKGRILWLVAEPGERVGVLCNVPEDYEHGRLPYAHLCEHGAINCYRERIGSLDDLTFTGVCQDVKPADDAWDNMMTWL